MFWIQWLWKMERCRCSLPPWHLGWGVDVKACHSLIHFCLPINPACYFQESGRCGRDGKQSHAVLVKHPGWRAGRIQSTDDMKRYSATATCHRQQLLQVFEFSSPQTQPAHTSAVTTALILASGGGGWTVRVCYQRHGRGRDGFKGIQTSICQITLSDTHFLFWQWRFLLQKACLRFAEQKNPNLNRVNCPLLESIAEENFTATAAQLMSPIEDETVYIRIWPKVLRVPYFLRKLRKWGATRKIAFWTKIRKKNNAQNLSQNEIDKYLLNKTKISCQKCAYKAKETMLYV